MKRFILFLLFACLAQPFCLAQSPVESPKTSNTFIGLLVAGNQSWFTGLDFSGVGASAGQNTNGRTDPEFGYKFGITVNHELSARFSMECSPGYVFEQSNHRNDFTDFHLSLSWVELPVTINYSFTLKKNLSVFVGSGFAVRKLTKSVMKITTTLSNGFSVNGSYDENINEWNVFPTIQLGGNIRLSDISRLTVLFAYQRSLSKLFRPSNLPPSINATSVDLDFTQNSFTCSMAYSVNVR